MTGDSTAAITCGGERLVLLAGGGAWCPARSALFIADLHLGKAAAFRRWGIPVPENTTADTLQRLTDLVRAVSPRRLVILGDLFHSASGVVAEVVDAVAAWRRAHPGLFVQLVRGNHDLRAGDPPGALDIECLDAPVADGGLALHHEPPTPPPSRGYALCGHVHPAVTLQCPTGHGERAKCFWVREGYTVLPAFGAFTGGKRVRPAPGDRVFAIGPGELFEVPPSRRAMFDPLKRR